MEIKNLKYFLAVAREENISGAAESLHLSQPTLSRQLRDLENELGKTLMIRGSRKITLTEECLLLRKRATEILNLTQRTVNDIRLTDDDITRDIFIGAGESECFRYIAKLAFPDLLQWSHNQQAYSLLPFIPIDLYIAKFCFSSLIKLLESIFMTSITNNADTINNARTILCITETIPSNPLQLFV